ncbi:MAG: hypothetical protein ABR936_07210 [Bacteroidota bacterium]|jgi:hypothetical protein
MSYQKEFLQIQEGRIADVTFLFPTGLKKEGNFGPYFLYTVKHEGKEKFLKVTERLEKELRKLNINTKQAYSLFKETIHPPKSEPYTLFRIVENKNPQPAPEPKAHASLVQSPVPHQPAAVQPQTVKVQDVNFTGDKQIMHQSMLDAVDITKAIGGIDWRNTDIEKIGVSLFLSRTGQLTTEQVLSNGNGKKPRKVKETPKAEPSRELVPADAVPSN